MLAYNMVRVYNIIMNSASGRPTDRIPDFIERLAAIPTSQRKRIWGVCMAEKSVMKRASYTPAQDEAPQRYSIAGLKNILTAYRNALRERFPASHPVFSYIRLSVDDDEEYHADLREKVATAHTMLRPIDDEALVAVALAIAAKPRDVHPMALVGALLLLTGRRTIEVLKTGVFTPITTSSTTMTFGGQAKRRDFVASDYTISVLGPPLLIATAIDVLRDRANTANLTNQQVNAKYSKHIGREVATGFKDANGMALIPMELRKAYSTISFAWLAPPEISMNAYFAQQLGHSPLDLYTALSYVAFYPIGQKRAFLVDHRTAVGDAIDAQLAALAAELDPETRTQIAERIERLREVHAGI